MPSPTKKFRRKSLTDIFQDLEIESNPPAPSPYINIAKSLLKCMQSTFRIGNGTVCPRSIRGVQAQFTISMDEAFDYKIGSNEFDPEITFPEIISLSDELSAILQKKLTPVQGTEFENHILISQVTFKLCLAIFRGEEVPEDVGETEEEFAELKKNLLRADLPANVSAVLRSRREIIQHAKAASYIITQLCLRDKDLTEEIILQTHKILMHKVNAEGTPWEEYSGVYRSDEVRTGFHQFPHPSLVPYKMKAMIHELQSNFKEAITKGEIDPISLASKYAHIFVNIHPFLDGNGRMCRLILNSMLLKLGSFLVSIGEKEQDRVLYMEVASNGGALEDLYGELDEDEKPVLHKELGSFVLVQVKKSMRKLVSTLRM
ncbi:hypothetical protein N7491_009878 [Penicillium cf. griseofulvum]|uniref:Fido domain-containing protein n=1 Tax=Penicillium cf. griseofulvum TaxID=2972120 RepID=A0A9W9T5J3_9EURO|nr:hypothetical protein N7472_000205 [Penicillium cf. griseofulvum]KAJ5421433.1 hypothetical protein N7491_009878 [Penicillium cf. griseofulvum]KAJ5424664.1 hypothetical protein N7445_010637 [Penicillium cf. griseofulvum]